MRTTRFITSSVVGLAAFVAACVDAPPTSPLVPSAPLATVTIGTPASFGTVQVEQFRVCKTGSSASFSYTVDYADATPDESGTFGLSDGQCASVAEKGGTGAIVSVTETGAQSGYQLDRVEVTSASGASCSTATSSTTTVAGPTVTATISGTAAGTLACRGTLAHFYNELAPVGEIGDFVWEDLNGNGIQDLGEPGIAGVLVTLGGAASATTTTDGTGHYLFSGLTAGNYTVTVGAGPTGYTASPADQGGDDAVDSDGTAPVNVTLPFNNSQDLTIDFGFVPPPPPPSGCTRTIGYWKTHAGFTGNNADVVTQYLPLWLGTANGAKSVQVTTATQAVSVLSMTGGASNGIVKLMAQLLGTKLSIAAGADGSAVASTISAADAFLAQNNAASWSSLTQAKKAQVNAWMTTLDNYNNGLIGPAHCQ